MEELLSTWKRVENGMNGRTRNDGGYRKTDRKNERRQKRKDARNVVTLDISNSEA